MSSATVKRWKREGAPQPVMGRPVSDWVTRVEAWREARQLERTRGGRPPRKRTEGEQAQLDWEARSKRALAMQREHTLAVAQGEYLPREEVLAEWTKRAMAVRTRLLALPRTLGGRCANMPADLIEKEADQIIRDCLLEYLEDSPLTPKGPQA